MTDLQVLIGPSTVEFRGDGVGEWLRADQAIYTEDKV